MSDVQMELEQKPELITVGRYRTTRQANDDTLLILSMGIAYWMIPVEQGYEVQVEADVAQEVIHQLERSRKENRFWPRNYEDFIGNSEGSQKASVLGYAVFFAVLVVTFLAQMQWGEGLVEAGSLNVRVITENHQWWRLLTALTLHADVPHLLGNLGLGSFFALFVLQRFGNRLGWSLILWAGVFGNLLNVWVHGEETFSAIGASTAVFGAVGITSGGALFQLIRTRSARHARDMMIPVFVALMMLAWWGSSGQNTDIIGHLMGLMCGILLGCAGVPLFARLPLWTRAVVAILSASAVGLAWVFALVAGS